MKPKHARMWLVFTGLAMAACGVALMLTALNDNIVFFYTPTQLAEKMKMQEFSSARTLRIGGLVKQGSVQSVNRAGLRFVITDLTSDVTVLYQGFVPSLFREGQGVVAQGVLDADGVLRAQQILAKHDENYMPREVMDALKASGRWRADGAGYQAPEGTAK